MSVKFEIGIEQYRRPTRHDTCHGHDDPYREVDGSVRHKKGRVENGAKLDIRVAEGDYLKDHNIFKAIRRSYLLSGLINEPKIFYRSLKRGLVFKFYLAQEPEKICWR